MSISSVDWLLQQSHKYPLLTTEQEIILNRYVREWLELRDKEHPTKKEQAIIRRGKRAYDRFFLSNIRMVVHVAARYKRFIGSMGLEDMIQEGMLGLERAIVKFDATRGYKFSTYAFNWVRQGINRSISNKSRMIRLPDNAILVIKKAYDYMNEQQRQNGRRPTVEELAEYCDVSVHTIKTYMPHGAPVISLDDKCKTEKGDASSLGDMIADEINTNELDEYSDMAASLLNLVEELGDVDRHILEQRYWCVDKEAPSFGVLANDLGITRQAVTLRHSKMLNRFRVRLNRQEPAGTPELRYAA